mmetsp:Transcript_18378/g.46286  ORF Transcript_18378/g.46286 Transcript_18378/m.46286 type:complete len:211 (-) Transcript_18378:1204-1836(-)
MLGPSSRPSAASNSRLRPSRARPHTSGMQPMLQRERDSTTSSWSSRTGRRHFRTSARCCATSAALSRGGCRPPRPRSAPGAAAAGPRVAASRQRPVTGAARTCCGRTCRRTAASSTTCLWPFSWGGPSPSEGCRRARSRIGSGSGCTLCTSRAATTTRWPSSGSSSTRCSSRPLPCRPRTTTPRRADPPSSALQAEAAWAAALVGASHRR